MTHLIKVIRPHFRRELLLRSAVEVCHLPIALSVICEVLMLKLIIKLLSRLLRLDRISIVLLNVIRTLITVVSLF